MYSIQQNSEISGSAVETHIPTVDDFVICKALSHGSFGEVYLAKKKSTKEYYALKVRLCNKAYVFPFLTALVCTGSQEARSDPQEPAVARLE